MTKREVDTKYYTFSQNNSGGYFIENEEFGVGSFIIIEAIDGESAISKLESFDDKVDGFFAYCECCGERWNTDDEYLEGFDSPMIYDMPAQGFKSWLGLRETAFIHYLEGGFDKIVFDKEDSQ